MAPKKKDKPNFKELSISNPKSGQAVDLTTGLIEFNYYESILSNHVTAGFTYADTGNAVGGGKDKKDVLNGLPVRGGEPVRIRVADQNNNELKFLNDDALYINRVKNAVQDTKSTIAQFDLCPKEYLANEQTRVVKRYRGKLSESVRMIASDVLGIKKVDVEETSNSYNFIGNSRKPFYMLTWLGTKSIPADGAYGKTAGFFFFQTQDGYQFKSVETLVGPTKGGGSANSKNSKKYEYTSTERGRSGFTKIEKYNLKKNIDLQDKLAIGAYDNISHFFNPYTFKVLPKEFNISKQKNQVKSAGTEIDFVMPEFRKEKSPTRGMTMVLDVGTMPNGQDGAKQVAQWKAKPEETNDRIMERVVQSIMRYNQLFSVNVDIMIEGDFTLRAGDTIYCEFPGLSSETKRPSKETSGLYLIASICHKVTPSRCYTSLNLIRDSFGKSKGN